MKSFTSGNIARIVAATALACMSAPALAHPGHDGVIGGFFAGVRHPLSGIDHIAAMAGIGVLIALSGRRDGTRLAGLVLLAFLAGGSAGIFGVGSALAEYAVLLSGLALAGMILLKHRMAIAAMFTLTTGFGFAHGMVHAMEMPAQSSSLLYMAGFTASSVALVAFGMTLPQLWQRFFPKQGIVRASAP